MSPKGLFKKILKWTGILTLLGFFVALLFYFSVYFGFWTPIYTQDQLAEIRQSVATEIYAQQGELLGKYYIFDRQPVGYEDLPKSLIDALIATEDVRFFEHNGVDRRSLARVIFKTILLRKESSGGGSTLSQQLIKNLYPREDHGVFSMPVNKVREAIMAVRLEKVYSKEEVLTLYLNTVPFGDNTFGVESASEKFFGKSCTDLNLIEAAVIVGMLKASHSYNPRLFPERSESRRNVVLNQMLRYGYLSTEEYATSKAKQLQLEYRPFTYNQGIAPYFRAELQKEMRSWLKEYNDANGTDLNLFTSGLKIYTTLDFGMQQMAEEATREHLSKLQVAFEQSHGKNATWHRNKDVISDAMQRTELYKSLKAAGKTEAEIKQVFQESTRAELFNWDGKKVVKTTPMDSLKHYLKFLNTGTLALDPRTGAVRTWVGGIDYEFFQYDHVRQAKRQVGSTIKPIVYATALESGVKPCTYYASEKITFPDFNDWTPENSPPVYDKNYAMKTALAQSVNTVAVRVLMDAGLQNVIALAEEMGIETDLPAVPSLALGTAELSVIELATAYTSFVNEGRPSLPYFINRIEDRQGNVLASFEPVVAENPVMTENTRMAMIEMMKGTVNEGTARRLRGTYGLPNDLAGKTGTTQNNRDGWFVSLSPRLVTVTWVGADDHRIGFRSTAMGQGANSALPIQALFYQKLNADLGYALYSQAQFPPPSVRVLNAISCAPEKKAGLFKRAFANNDKPRAMELDIDSTAKAPEKKEGFLKRLFRRKSKEEKEERKKKRKEKRKG